MLGRKSRIQYQDMTSKKVFEVQLPSKSTEKTTGRIVFESFHSLQPPSIELVDGLTWILTALHGIYSSIICWSQPTLKYCATLSLFYFQGDLLKFLIFSEEKKSVEVIRLTYVYWGEGCSMSDWFILPQRVHNSQLSAITIFKYYWCMSTEQ